MDHAKDFDQLLDALLNHCSHAAPLMAAAYDELATLLDSTRLTPASLERISVKLLESFHQDITDEVFALTLQHVLQMCEATTAYREAVGLADFFANSKARGHGSRTAYTLYLTGRAPDGSTISRSDYMSRGSVLENLRKEWLSMWT